MNSLSKMVRSRASDMDGVICQDCPSGLPLCIAEYEKWMSEVGPLFIPPYKLNGIVTCRLEKYRKITELWLENHNVKYGRLWMWNREKYDGCEPIDFANRKIGVLKKIRPDIFYESSPVEAEIINHVTGIPVFVWPTKTLLI